MKNKNAFRWLSKSFIIVMALFFAGCHALQPQPVDKHDFGKILVGTTATSGAVQWKNISSGPQDVVGLLVSPLGSNPFNYTPQPFTFFTLQSNGISTNFTFTFTPTQSGTFSAAATPQIISGGGTSKALQLEGVGIFQAVNGGLSIGGGQLVLDQALDFGSVLVPGGAPSERHFSLANVTAAPIQANVSWSAGNQGFSLVSPTAPITVPPHSRVTVKLRFIPPAVGTFTEVITFTDAASGANWSATTLKGTGIAPQ